MKETYCRSRYILILTLLYIIEIKVDYNKYLKLSRYFNIYIIIWSWKTMHPSVCLSQCLFNCRFLFENVYWHNNSYTQNKTLIICLLYHGFMHTFVCLLQHMEWKDLGVCQIPLKILVHNYVQNKLKVLST